MRKSEVREAIIELFKCSNRPIAAQEIIDEIARDRPAINKSTVYRFINTLIESELLVTIALPGRALLYELRDRDAHHHFTCEECHEVTCLKAARMRLNRMVPDGYSVSPQHLVLSGRCPKCVE
jgi:Fe2+ or Zn2+ uptake regulation protein